MGAGFLSTHVVFFASLFFAMAVVMMVLYVLFLGLPQIFCGIPVHRCYSTNCTSPGLCIKLCQPGEHYCRLRYAADHLNRFLFTEADCSDQPPPEDGLAFQQDNVSVINGFVRFPDVFWICQGDLCDYLEGKVDNIHPFLDLPVHLPAAPVPSPQQGDSWVYGSP